MPARKYSATEISQLRQKGWTAKEADFREMINRFDRPSLIFAGDSWAAYPPKSLISSSNSNISRHIRSWIKSKASMLHVAKNGDEATAMLSGKQKHAMAKRLQRYQPTVLLFSGGGNDVVGEFDLLRFIMPYQNGMTAHDCINHERWNRKAQQIELAHRELIELCEEFSPATKIVTHTYDIPFVSGKKSEFWKLKVTGPWIKPFLGNGDTQQGWSGRGIPDGLHRPVIDIIFKDVRNRLNGIANDHPARYFVAQTHGLLTTEDLWRDELHPTTNGFKIIARAVYSELRSILPTLPANN